MKVFQVDFDYTETASVPNVVAKTADEAVLGAAELIKSYGRPKDASNFRATETEVPKMGDVQGNETIN